MFATLTKDLLDLRSQRLGRPAELFAMTLDCCSCSCTTCWPQPFCFWGGDWP